MAIDTKAKRASALLEGFVVPDGTISAADRSAARWHYSGIAISSLAVAVALYPGDVTVTRTGPGDTILTRTGPGAATVGRRTT